MSKDEVFNFKDCVDFFNTGLKENFIRLVFLQDKMIVGRKEEFKIKINESELDLSNYQDIEPKIVNMVGLLLDGNDYEKIISVFEDDFNTNEEIRENLEYISKKIIDEKFEDQYALFSKSSSSKLLDYDYEINNKVIDKKEIKTAQVSLSVLKPYSDLVDTDIEEVVFDLTLNGLEDLIDFLVEVKEDLEVN